MGCRLYQYVRLRSANRGSAYYAWNVNTSGNANNNVAASACRPAPDCENAGPIKPYSKQGRGQPLTQGAESPAERLNNTTVMPRTYGPDRLSTQEIFMEIDEESVIGFDALYESMMRCKKGVIWKDSVAAYYHRAIERTEKLCADLRNGTYKAAPPKHFTITSPKPREIASIAFRDRVYQRSLNDNVVYPVMTNGFIYDNAACQTGKGTDFARNRLKEFLHWHYRKHGTSGYVAQLDIHGYYPNMQHSEVEKMFQKKLPDWAYKRVVKILHEQYEGDTGYNPGSQLVQIAGISLLNDIDHYIKERLHIKCYIRYMDDLILIHPDEEYLKSCMAAITKRLALLGFEVNPKKTRVYPLLEGIMFLGFHFRLSDTGKVYLIADSSKIKTNRKKYKRLVAKSKRGEVPRENVNASFETWMQHLSKGNSQKAIARLIKYYKSLWEAELNDCKTRKNDPG